MRKTEKQKEIDQSSRIRNADRGNIVHWKLAKEYSKIPLEFAKNENRKEILAVKKSIEELYERLEIKSMYQENKKV